MFEFADSGIGQGDLDRAAAEWDGDETVGAYLWWWSGGRFGRAVDDRWDGVLAGRTVELRGPAEFVPSDCDMLARVLRGSEPDASCDVAFCNIGHWPQVDKGAARLAFVSKGPEALTLPHGRRLWDSRSVFAGGDWNMVPAALLDLMSGGARVTVTGATFYAVGPDYRDEDGMTPASDLVAHNPLVNWRVVKNLFDAGVVGATGLAAEVLSWDPSTYRDRMSVRRTVD